jgi:hypothetical protein
MEDIKSHLIDVLQDRYSEKSISELYLDVDFCIQKSKQVPLYWTESLPDIKSLPSITGNEYYNLNTKQLDTYFGSNRGNFIEGGYRYFINNGYRFKERLSIILSEQDKIKILDKIETDNYNLSSGEIVDGEMVEREFFVV